MMFPPTSRGFALMWAIACSFSGGGYDVQGATTFYVRESASGTNCTEADPCGSIQTAVDLATAGDRDEIEIGPGNFTENLVILQAGLVLKGSSDGGDHGSGTTMIVSAGGIEGVEAPEGVPVDVILDIRAPNVTVKSIQLRHGEGEASKRDVGIFVRPPANNVLLSNVNVSRDRTGEKLEPFSPGSRGLLVFRATGCNCADSGFSGNYQDHIHLPTSKATITNTKVIGATRLGIVVIQETSDSDSTGNAIQGTTVSNSGSDGIQIQGDGTLLEDVQSDDNGGYGVHVCGLMSDPACVAPGGAAIAENTSIIGALDSNFSGNALGGLYFEVPSTSAGNVRRAIGICKAFALFAATTAYYYNV